VALQGAGKAGEFILDDNKLAVAKVTVDGTPTEHRRVKIPSFSFLI